MSWEYLEELAHLGLLYWEDRKYTAYAGGPGRYYCVHGYWIDDSYDLYYSTVMFGMERYTASVWAAKRIGPKNRKSVLRANLEGFERANRAGNYTFRVSRNLLQN
jgi:hypothetical protein